MAIYDQLGRSDYTPSADLPQKTLGWAMEAVQESDYYVRNQQGYGRAARMKRMLVSEDRPARPLELSTTTDNELGRIYNVLSADLTDIRAFWQYETMNDRYRDHAQIQSNILKWWFPQYGEAGTEMVARSALIYGIGVGNLRWHPGLQEIIFEHRNPHDVRPVRPAGDLLSFQDCLAVVDVRERPVHHVRQMFPHAKHLINMERDASVAAMMRTAETKVYGKSPLQIAQSMTNPPVGKLGAIPVLDLFYIYVDDQSVNEEDWDVEMGDWGYAADGSNRRIALNDWSYKVKPNDPLYPLKRLIICTRQVILYDGPSMYWHGMFPYAKFNLDIIPDTWFGKSPLWACIPLQESYNRLMRAVDDHVGKIINPGKQAPKVGVAKSEFDKYKTNMGGMGARYGPAGKIETDIIPDLDPIVEKQMERILARMQQHGGVQQLAMLASLGQIPEGDSIEKLLFSMSPEIRARSRSLERFQREVGVMFSYDATEFYSFGKRIWMLGDDGQTVEDYDIDPDSLIPAYTANDYDNTGRLVANASRDPRPRFERAREHNRQFSLFIKPASMLNSAQTKEKMEWLVMRRQGDIPLYPFLKKMEVPNLGPEPKENIIEQVMQEKMMAAAAGGPMPNPGAGAKGPMQAHRGAGHPPSGKQSPHMRNDGRVEET